MLLTRKLASAEEVRAELEMNLVVGSLWVPVPETSAATPGLSVEVMLVLPDGRVLDGIRGRVFCRAPQGATVFVDSIPPVALTVLKEVSVALVYLPPEEAAKLGETTKVGVGALPSEIADLVGALPTVTLAPLPSAPKPMNPLFRAVLDEAASLSKAIDWENEDARRHVVEKVTKDR